MRSCEQMWKHTLPRCLSEHAGCRTCPSRLPRCQSPPSCQQRGACVAHQVALGEPGVTLPRQKDLPRAPPKDIKVLHDLKLALLSSICSCLLVLVLLLVFPVEFVLAMVACWGGAGRSWVSGETILIITDAT